MLSTIKPIIVTISGLEDAIGTYLEYEVRMQYNTDSSGSTSTNTLFYGKSFVDAYGDTEIHLERLLRDYLWRWSAKYVASAQNHKPECIKGSLATQLKAIEATSDNLFFNTKIDLVYTYNDTEVTETLQVCGAWVPAFQKGDTICCALEDEAITSYIQNYATIATDILPHIPPTETSNFWLGLVLNINQAAEADVSDIGIGADSSNVVSLTLTHGGTYAMAYPLTAIFQELDSAIIDGGDSDSTYYSSIDGGDSDSTFDGDYDGGTSDDSGYESSASFAGSTLSVYWNHDGTLYSTPIAEVDTCAKRYYIAWITPTGGWTSYGMDGNVSVKSAVTQKTIVNLRDENEVLTVAEKPTFDLYSGMVDAETYMHLVTMLSSHILYVYDSENDTGYYCTATTNAASTLPSKTGKMASFHVELTAINTNEQ